MSTTKWTAGMSGMLSARPSKPARFNKLLRGFGWALLVLAALLSVSLPASAEVEPGTVINNVANSAYTVGVQSATSQSNTHSLTVLATPTTAVMNA